ncbi:squamosa promoter-binding 9 [Olea europaea subsp. europaea]|uniref:Squamosa promoter-binding 9 n=1 Tax=Olea europaea subsp. europaea TaxID=158383 RepID=A0A8S0RJM2_OLEEU|nr:squamosa promoter-binding 9 [Olea europaea subsp. europaea]
MELGSASASSSSSSTSGGSESLNGFKFGKKIYFEDVGVGVQDKFGGGPPSLPPKATGLPPPSPAKKRRRSMVQSGQPPRCQVEGCEADLSGAKANYSRHKMCGTHSKSPKVIVAGLEQREFTKYRLTKQATTACCGFCGPVPEIGEAIGSANGDSFLPNAELSALSIKSSLIDPLDRLKGWKNSTDKHFNWTGISGNLKGLVK